MPSKTNPLLLWEAKERGRDRHVRRDGDDYTYAFLSLLPVGQAWPRLIDCTNDETTLYRVCRGLAYYWGFVDGRAADLLERESDPRQAIELLSDWERAWGLPDPCFPDATTLAERQRMLVMRITWMGGQSREYFTKLMQWLGFEVYVKELAPFMVGITQAGDTRQLARQRYEWVPDRYDYERGYPVYVPRPTPSGYIPLPGDEIPEGRPDDNFRWYIGAPEIRFYWSANTARRGLNWFRAGSGEAGVDHHLEFRTPQDLECLLNRWKPAHTQLVFDFDYHPFGDPMEQTEEPLPENVIRWPNFAPHIRGMWGDPVVILEQDFAMPNSGDFGIAQVESVGALTHGLVVWIEPIGYFEIINQPLPVASELLPLPVIKTTLQSDFTMPVPNETSRAYVEDSEIFHVGQRVFLAGVGWCEIVRVEP